jgi:SAM-dependent methyltransferase
LSPERDLGARLRGRKMVLCLPCGDGEILSALREAGVPAVGIDTSAPNIAACRQRGLAAFTQSWHVLDAHVEKFDAIICDLGVTGTGLATADRRGCMQALAASLLPGGLLLLKSRGMISRADLPVSLGFAEAGLGGAEMLTLVKLPRAQAQESTSMRVAPYADLLVGCERVYEIGCGSGRFLDTLRLRDLDVSGCEQDLAAAARARTRGLAVVTGGLEQLARHVGEFGGLFVGPVVEALDEPAAMSLLETARVALRPNGRLVVRACADATLARLAQQAQRAGFAGLRYTAVPGEARDGVLVGFAPPEPPLALPRAQALAAIALPTLHLASEQPPTSLFDLERFERRDSSQCGEDGVLEAIFAQIGAPTRSYVEFGCGDGEQCNTAALRRQGWHGLLMDAVAETTTSDTVIHQAWVTAENIESLLDTHAVPSEPDLLSIDLDGNDYWVWRAIKRRPRVVVAEYNANLGARAAVTIPYDPNHRWDGTDYYGASLAALHGLARSKGYTLVYCTQAGVNAFFVRDDLMGGARAPALASLYRPPNYWYRGARQLPDLSGRAMQSVDETRRQSRAR